MEAVALNVPSEETAREAGEAVRALALVPRSDKQAVVRVQPQGAEPELAVTLPIEAFELLMQVLAHMANGNAVTVLPVQAELTTQQAAELLRVSRPYLVRLLDEGTIPHHKVGTHRRVKVTDLLAYLKRDDAERQAAADALSSEAQELGLY